MQKIKKISTILMALLLLVSLFSFSVAAEGEPVNYASAGQYVIESSNATPFLTSLDGTKYYGDDACTILNDGVKPYYAIEEPGLGVVLVGSSAVHTITFDLGANYDDIYELSFINVWDSYNFGYELAEDGKGNRGFRYDKAIINLSQDGVNYERTKDYEVEITNHTEDGSENGFYDYKFKFNSPVTAKAVQMMIFSPTYCLSLSEIEIYGYGHSIETPEVSVEESSEEYVEESFEEVVDEASSEAAEGSKVEESKAEESKAEESKAEESKTEESKTEESKAEENKDGASPVIFIVIGVAVVAVVAVVVIVLKKKK